MLPRELADFSLQPGTRVTDSALTTRLRDATRGPRVLVFGCLRLGLVEALVDADLDVVVVDSSRRALLHAEAALADGGRAGRATLLAQDPRELEIPDGADAIVLPSLSWRALVTRDRIDVLDAFVKTLRPEGVLCLDLERVAATDEGVTRIPTADGVHVTLTTASPEELLDEVRAAGLVVSHTEPIGDPDAARAPCLFAIARRPPA